MEKNHNKFRDSNTNNYNIEINSKEVANIHVQNFNVKNIVFEGLEFS